MDSEQFLPPVPRALSDEELQEVLDRAKAEGGGVLAAMQILEAQAQLRETDKSELRAWQSQMNQARSSSVELGAEEQDATAMDEALPEPAPAPIVEVVVQTKRGAKDPSSSQFWVWLPISGSLLPFGISLWLRSLGLTFAQSLTAAALGILVSAGVVAIGAIAGKRSSLPTLVLSRAAFGVVGNLAPALVLVLSRLFWSLVLVILGYLLIAQSLTSTSELSGEAAPISWLAVAILGATVATSVLLSSLGGRKLVWAQRLSGVVGLFTALTVAVCRFVGSGVAQEGAGSGSWLRALGAAVVIFAVFGLAWTSASSDYASGLPVNTRGWKVAGWAVLAMGVIPMTLALLGLLAFGNLTNTDFAASFDGMVAGGNLSALSVLVQGSLILTLITTIAMSLKSSSMSFESIHLKVRASAATPVIALVAIILAVVGLSRLGASGFWLNLNGYALFLAVPVAAWSGIFISDVLIRRIAYHEVSLSRSYGFYKSVNPMNLIGWLVAVAIGFGLLRSQLVEFQWVGYLSNYASNPLFWFQSNFGVVIAFAIGLLLPVLGGIPRIKRQELEVLAIEARRNDLKDVLGMVD